MRVHIYYSADALFFDPEIRYAAYIHWGRLDVFAICYISGGRYFDTPYTHFLTARLHNTTWNKVERQNCSRRLVAFTISAYLTLEKLPRNAAPNTHTRHIPITKNP